MNLTNHCRLCRKLFIYIYFRLSELVGGGGVEISQIMLILQQATFRKLLSGAKRETIAENFDDKSKFASFLACLFVCFESKTFKALESSQTNHKHTSIRLCFCFPDCAKAPLT